MTIRAMLSDTAAGEECGRFAVVVSNAERFDVWLFDKREQSDPVERVSLPMQAGVTARLGALVVAWQTEGAILQ